MPENIEPTIRVHQIPNLDVILSNTGFERYADKRARIDKLLEEGIAEERANR